jgi:hypothetical protein
LVTSYNYLEFGGYQVFFQTVSKVQGKISMQNLSTGHAFLKPGAWDDAVTEAGPVFLECSSSLAFTASKHTQVKHYQTKRC